MALGFGTVRRGASKLCTLLALRQPAGCLAKALHVDLDRHHLQIRPFAELNMFLIMIFSILFCPLWVLKGTYDYWTYVHFFQGAQKQMEDLSK